MGHPHWKYRYRGTTLPAIHDPAQRITPYLDITPELTAEVVQLVLTGVDMLTAAIMCGVTRAQFGRWYQLGRREIEAAETADEAPELPLSPRAVFYLAVVQAKSRCQAMAEIAVYQDNPELWLTKGPARDDWGDHATVAVEIHNAVQQAVTAVPEFESAEQWQHATVAALADAGLLIEADDPAARGEEGTANE